MNTKRPICLFIACLLSLTVLLGACEKVPPSPPVVLFDEGHGQRFVVGKDGPLDLSSLGKLFVDAGFVVRSQGEKFTAENLQGVDAVILSGPFQTFTAEEMDALSGFVEKGGKLSVMLHVGPLMTELLDRFHIFVSNGAINEMDQLLDDKSLDFRVTDLTSHPLTNNLPGIDIYGGWALMNKTDDMQILARTGPHAWIDLNRDQTLSKGDASQSFGVLVCGPRGKGEVAVFGDDAIFQNRFLAGNNLQLAKNLVVWLRPAS